ncbi:MAG: hypothetical protein EHM42_09015, partial [Planctomycetaceae bacterium]
MGFSNLLCAAITPALLALVVFALLWKFAGTRTAGGAAAIAGMALSAGVCGGYLASIRLLSLARPYPVDGWEWLPWLTLLASVVGGAAASPRWPRWLLPALAGGVAILVAAIVVPRWPSLLPQRPWWMAVGAVAVAGSWVVLDAMWRDRRGLTAPVALALAGTTIAIVAALSGSLKFGQLAGFGVAALAGTILAASIGSAIGAVRGAIPGFTVQVYGTLLVAYLYSADSIPVAAFLLAGAGPLLLA